MSLIEHIRQKSHAQKVRLIWTIVIVSILMLIILWVFTSKISSTVPKDTSLFDTIRQGFHDIKDNYKKQ